MQLELKPCPFCGGRPKVFANKGKYTGSYDAGTKRVVWNIYVRCNYCRSRGKPVSTGAIKPSEGEFWSTIWGGKGYDSKATEVFRPFVEMAIEAWNGRING